MADDADVAPELEEADLRAIDAAGTRRRTTAGEYLYRQGDATYDFVTVVSGAVDIVVAGGGDEHRIIRQGARRFLGELNLLSGRHLSVSARVAAAVGMGGGGAVNPPVPRLRPLRKRT